MAMACRNEASASHESSEERASKSSPCVGKGGYEGRPALEAGQRVLLDGQGMEPGADAMRLPLPFRDAGELLGEVGLPEGDMADPADPEDHDQFR